MVIADGGWTRVTLLEPAIACPAPWIAGIDEVGVPLCHRDATLQNPSNGSQQAPVVFPVPIAWTEVLGAIEGRAMDSPDAWAQGQAAGINGIYADGVSVCSIAGGAVRTHLFSFASSHIDTDNDCGCPAGDNGPPAPAFAGDRWVCDRPEDNDDGGYDQSRLWDPIENECFPADFAALGGYFTSSVGATAIVDPIEVRLMASEGFGNEDVALVRLELYVR
jgi:hypothetical protein